ncbi:MAG: glutamine-hydrolyzing carbamoyl-phosphate synthase small subunit [Clostridia bacterium]|nr:glutamine-hydrolyzing carbamoyl-phosphate synthase small subunit [Clostridia bacterium]
MDMKKAFIVLEDGHVFEGKRFGADGDALGELVFTTGMVGYIETLTDPCYCGQIVVQTFPLLGNYGMIYEDTEGKKSYVKGVVVREWCEAPSNFRCDGDIDEYLKKENIVGICDIDTREITQIIREKGVMNAKIVDEITDEIKEELKNYKVADAVRTVSSGVTETYEAEGDSEYTVAVVDFGEKSDVVKQLTKRGCKVVSVPYDTSADDILALGADGVVLSDGPGNPADNAYSVEQVKALMGKAPMFGISLGHQIMALANGGKTEKHKYGHRGANQPVKNLEVGQTYITSQNHGYVVDADSLNGVGELAFVNANDGTCEGVKYPDKKAFSVQFHPAAGSGPMDTEFLYDEFVKMMGGKN